MDVNSREKNLAARLGKQLEELIGRAVHQLALYEITVSSDNGSSNFHGGKLN